MSKAVILISSDTSYLEQKLSVLNYTTYAIDQFRYKNIHKLDDIEFVKNLLDKVLLKHEKVYLVYGSGLEDKNHIYDLLTNRLRVKGNKLNILSNLSDLNTLKSTLHAFDLKIPFDFINSESAKDKYIWKPFNSAGGYGISYKQKNSLDYYRQKYLPGDTFSVSFMCNDVDFKNLGFNKLLLLKDYPEHPFIHAGAIMTQVVNNSEKIIRSFRGIAKELELNGYNNIDFNLIKNNIYILDINPRITSTFKMYNDIYDNKLLQIQLNDNNITLKDLTSLHENIYGFVHLFAKDNFIFKQYLNDDTIINMPQNDEYIKKGDPIFSIYLNALSDIDLVLKLKEKISNLRNYYNFYDIVI